MDTRRHVLLALLLLFLGLGLLAGGFGAGVMVERSLAAAATPTATEPESVQETFKVFWEAWNLAQQHYVDRQAIDARRQTYGAIQGMLDSLGDLGHTRFLSPEALKSEEEALSGQFEGIGAHLLLREGRPTILAPIQGSPAQRAGLRPGDVIERVDGKDVTALSIDEVVKLVRGPKGTAVTLTVIHADETEPVDITVVRDQINVPSVLWTILPGTKVGHVAVTQFSDRSTENVARAVGELKNQGAQALILDLRNDPGGLRDEAIGVASQFLKQGNVLIEVNAQGQRKTYPAKPGGAATDLPLIVLVNEGTASSAEIVAGAIQDQQRARILGTTTLGTGTVLSVYKLSDGSAIFLGTEGWLTPNGREIWHKGIEPDIIVALPAGASSLTPTEASNLTADQFRLSEDAQLLRALEELVKELPSG